MNITSKEWRFIEEEDNYIIGFLGKEEGTHVIIQNAKKYNEQDRRLGMDSHHLELNNQQSGGYNLIQSVQVDLEKIHIHLNTKGLTRLGLPDLIIEIQEGNRKIADLLKEKFGINIVNYLS